MADRGFADAVRADNAQAVIGIDQASISMLQCEQDKDTLKTALSIQAIVR
jgi:hypothetical protein